MTGVAERTAQTSVGTSQVRQKPDRGMSAITLLALFLGVPMWWVLGLFQAAFFIAAALMGAHLMRRRDLKVPRGFGVWLLFLVWLLGGVFVLQVDAPGAVPGQSGGRYLTYGYRFGWYLICTIAGLYVLNTKRTVPSERVCAAIAWFFVMLVGGGLLGALRPQLSFPSALELVLPGAVTRHKFVNELIHPNVAQIHDFLGSDGARPSAPFAYTNDWGMAAAIALPFFVMVWWRRRGAWRWAMLGILAAGVVPIVASLNRGLWLSILASVVFTVVRSALAGRVRLLVGILALVVTAGAIVVMSPLGALIQARIDTPHSDEGRTNLSIQSVLSTLEGSPVIGFGSTRDVAGNFTSIAGGATEECPKCSPPPMGTHGQAWLLIFASGFGGFLLFTAFIVGQFLRSFWSRSPTAAAALACLVVLFVTMPIYNSIGVPLFIGFIAIGLLARERDDMGAPSGSLARLTGPIHRGANLVLALALLGGASGLLVHHVAGQPVRATQAVLVPVVDLIGVPNARPLSLDAEALLVRSESVLDAIGRATGTTDRDEILDRLLVGAEPNTRVLTISYRGEDGREATAAVEAAVSAFLSVRESLGRHAHETVSSGLVAQHHSLNEIFRSAENATARPGDARTQQGSSTLGWLRYRMAETLSGSQVFDAAEVGHPVTAVTVHRNADSLLVRAGSGLTLGVTAGLVMAWCLDDRRMCRSRHGARVLNLPVVHQALTGGGHPGVDQSAAQALRRFRPLCDLLADPQSPEAMAFARRMDTALGPTAERRGSRALLVVSDDTRLRAITRLTSRCRHMGVQPVGLVVITDGSHSRGEHVK